jgi:hypothetical protein
MAIDLMERICERDNLTKPTNASKQQRRAGVDGMRSEGLYDC